MSPRTPVPARLAAVPVRAAARLSLVIAGALGLACLWVAGPAHAQLRQATFEVHDRGELWETVKDDGTLGAPNPMNPLEYYPSADWPGGPHRLATKDDQRSYHAGMGLWLGGRRANGAVFFTEHGPFGTVDEGTIEPMQRRENYVGTPGYDPGEAEQVITAQFTTTAGLRVRRTSRAWSFRGLNTFILYQYDVTNVTAETLAEVYVGFPSLLRPSYQDINVHNGWGDSFNRVDDLVGYDEERRLVYVYDDTPNFDLPTNVGNYWSQADELRTTGYIGLGLLDAPIGSNGEAQPSNVLWAQLLSNEIRLTLANTTREALYAILSGADRSLQAQPGERLSPFVLMAAGPYTLAPNQSVRISLVQAVNGLPRSMALQGLAAQPQLPAGLDSLRASVRRAQRLYGAGYAVTNVPPPAPVLEIIPVPTSQSISISWQPLDQTWSSPTTGARITEYRIYRSHLGFIGPYTQVAPQRVRVNNQTDITRFRDAQRGVWRINDNNVGLGFSYHYAITAVDEAGRESWLTSRNEQAIRVASSPAEDVLNVRVFPNPFREVSGFPATADANSIVWNNLPARATIRIYTSSGELVRTIEHDNPAAGQAVWNQLSDARQRTAPGIYFWTVQSEVGVARGSLVIIK
jgi:hypothetical protein